MNQSRTLCIKYKWHIRGFLGILLILFALPLNAYDTPEFFRNNLDEYQEYTVKRGDTLWGLAKQFYGNPHYWHLLWHDYGGKMVGNRYPLIVQGDAIVVSPIKGAVGDIHWEDLTYNFGEWGINDVAYNFRDKYWLFGGDRLFSIGRVVKPTEVRGVLYRYEENGTISSLSHQLRRLTPLPVKTIFFDGDKFWISAHDALRGITKLRSDAPPILMTYEGKIFRDRSDIFIEGKRIPVFHIDGTKDQILFGSGRHELFFYDGVETIDLSAEIVTTQAEGYPGITDIKYNGKYWAIVVNGQLFTFDGNKIENHSIYEVLDSIQGKNKRGIRKVSWDSKRNGWLLVGRDYEEDKHDVLALYSSETRMVEDLKNKFDIPTPRNVADTPFGWFVSSQGKNLGIIRDGYLNFIRVTRPMGDRRIACSEEMCFLVSGRTERNNAFFKVYQNSTLSQSHD